jgi:hypothetical protein
LNPEDLITEITEGRSSNDAANLTDVNVEEEMKRLRPEIEEWYYRYDRWKYDVAREKRHKDEEYEDEDEINDEDDDETVRGVEEEEEEEYEDEDDNESVCGVDKKEKAGNIHLFIFPILKLFAANRRF